jgi:hypothetical protein
MASVQGNRKIHMDLVIKAVIFPFNNILGIIRLGLVPTLIASGVIYAAYRAIGPIKWPTQSIGELGQLTQVLLPLSALLSFCSAIVGTLVAVGIHRLILHGERPAWTVIRIRKYELAYGAIVLTILAAAYALDAAGRFIFGFPKPGDLAVIASKLDAPGTRALIAAVAMIGGGLFLWIYVRLILVFPHAALTGEISARKAWAAMRGNFWRFVGASLLLGLISLPIHMVYLWGIHLPLIHWLEGGRVGIGNTSDPISTMLVFGLISIPVRGLVVSMFIALVSYVYKHLVQGSAFGSADVR